MNCSQGPHHNEYILPTKGKGWTHKWNIQNNNNKKFTSSKLFYTFYKILEMKYPIFFKDNSSVLSQTIVRIAKVTFPVYSRSAVAVLGAPFCLAQYTLFRVPCALVHGISEHSWKGFIPLAH